MRGPLGRTALVVFLLALTAPNADALPTGSNRATFDAHTAGSPIASAAGRWSVDERSARLVFSGANAAGSHTKFIARWTTARLPGSAAFSGTGQLVGLSEEGRAPISLTWAFRYRTDTKNWSPWRTAKKRLANVFNFHQEIEGVQFPFKSRWRQFDWKLQGDMKDLASVTGSIDLTTQ